MLMLKSGLRRNLRLRSTSSPMRAELQIGEACRRNIKAVQALCVPTHTEIR